MSSQSQPPLPTSSVTDRLLVGVTGSMSAMHLPAYLVALRSFYAKEVTLMVTRAAEAFIRPQALALYADHVWLDSATDLSPGHVELAEWAEDFIVLPATVNILGQVAHGLAPGRLTATALAWPSGVSFFPSANSVMWANPGVRRNVQQLRADGHTVFYPVLRNVYRASTRRVHRSEAIPEPEAVVKLLRLQHEARASHRHATRGGHSGELSASQPDEGSK